MSGAETFDVAIIGGGPSGATAAIHARRRGLRVVLLEKASHPRFHIGESLLPRHLTLLRELGLLDRVLALPHVPKFGASFAMAQDTAPTDFWFSRGPRGEDAQAVNIERAPFDALLFQIAGEEGAELRRDTPVSRVLSLEPGDVRLETRSGIVRARLAFDATGQAALLGKHLGTRRTLPDLCRVAYFQHFTGVERREGKIGGHPIIVMADDGWFWVIPIDQSRTSIGLVMEQDLARNTGIPAREMLRWGMARSPFMERLSRHAQGEPFNEVCADFSYSCRPFAGPGYFLLGDAATFVDPIFSTGVCLGMMSAVKAADLAADSLSGRITPAAASVRYIKYLEGSTGVFFNLVRRYYGHGFREMFLNGTGPLSIHKAILSILAGHVFPKPVFSLRWRLAFFEHLLRTHERRELVPPRDSFSLVQGTPIPRHAARRTAHAGATA